MKLSFVSAVIKLLLERSSGTFAETISATVLIDLLPMEAGNFTDVSDG